MLFKIKRGDIIQNIQSTAAIIERKQTMAILSNVLLKTGKDEIIMVGTDLEVQLETRSTAEIQREGEATVSAQKFLDICRNFSDDAVFSVELDQEKILIRSGRTRFQLSSLNAKHYPEFATDTYTIEFAIPSHRLLKILQSTSFCMANQDVRYYLNGLMIEINNTELGAVASDGHRLAMYHDQLEKTANDSKQMIVPRKGIAELVRLLDDPEVGNVRIRISESNVEMALNQKVFLAKLIDGAFPDFRSPLSQAIFASYSVDTLELKQALRRIAVLSHEKFRRITLVMGDNLLAIHTDNAEHEQADEELDIAYSGERLEVGLNVSYLLDAVNNIENDSVEISFTEKTNICLITNPVDRKLNYVVMPLI